MFKISELILEEIVFEGSKNKNTSYESNLKYLTEVRKFTQDFVDTVYQVALAYTPYDTGVLKENSILEKVKDVKGVMVYRIEYDAPYAYVVHENFFNSHEYPTRAHYLMDAYYETRNYYESIKYIPKGVELKHQLERTIIGGVILTMTIQYGII